MNEIRVLFGKPATQDSARLISALKDLQSRYGCIAQALDANLVVSERHICFAAEKALAAFSEKRNIAKDMGMEIMRYASGERQIEKALVIGITDRTKRIALVLVSLGDGCRWPESSELSGIIELDGRGFSFDVSAVIEAFHITPAELIAVGEERIDDLVLERVALADAYR
jgi:KEOPS complex subunit Cgi121